jgi:hypothetical protein
MEEFMVHYKGLIISFLLIALLAGAVIAADMNASNIDKYIQIIKYGNSTEREEIINLLKEHMVNITRGEDILSPGIIEKHHQYLASINYSWLANVSLDDQLDKANIAGGDVNKLETALENDDFFVQQGLLKTISIFDLVNKGVLFSANGNNPSTPYKAFILPRAPGQMSLDPFSDSANFSIAYRLRPDEAIIFIGRTPPSCKYFSYQSFLLTRYYPQLNVFKKIFANLGDTINRFTIKTNGTPNGTEGDPFNQPVIIIVTADKGTANRVLVAVQSAGYPRNIVNIEIIPSPILKMGLENESDTFTLLNRMAFFQDKDAGNDYINSTPGAVFRLTPNNTSMLDPYPIPNLRVRGTGNTSELQLIGALSELRGAILNKYNSSNATELTTSVWLTEGYDAIQRNINVIGVTRDTTYLNTTPFILSNNSSDFLIVYGVNHAAWGKVVYSNFGIYGLKLENGVVAVDDSKLRGTAEEYLPNNPMAKYLYVWKVSRHCDGGQHCTEVPTGPGAYGIGLNKEAFVGFRAYIENQTMVGPSYTELVYDRVIKFSA